MTVTFDDRMRAADPARDRPGYDEASAHQMLHRIRAGAGVSATANRSASSTGWGRRRVLQVAAAAATVTVLGGALAVFGPGSASAEASAILTRAAAATIVTADPPARASQYWIITTRATELRTSVGQQGDSVTYLVGSTRTEYVAVDGQRPTVRVDTGGETIRQLHGSAGVDAPTPRREVWAMNLAPAQLPSGWQSGSPGFIASLPRDPTALRLRLYFDVGHFGRQRADHQAFVYVADLLRTGLVPADLRAPLFKVLRTVPGVTVTDRAASANGHAAVALSSTRSNGYKRQELLLAPDSGMVIGERTVYLQGADGVPAGLTTDGTVTRSLVDGVPETVRRQVVMLHCQAGSDGSVSCTP